jgi:hypothetical protein
MIRPAGKEDLATVAGKGLLLNPALHQLLVKAATLALSAHHPEQAMARSPTLDNQKVENNNRIIAIRMRGLVVAEAATVAGVGDVVVELVLKLVQRRRSPVLCSPQTV